MKEMTSALANKLLKQLGEEKDYWSKHEKETCVYTVAKGEEAVVPEYDFEAVNEKLKEIDRQIVILKHAINVYNLNTVLELQNGRKLTIDEALVVMAQLTRRKGQLDMMREMQPKTRINDRFARNSELIEYQYINFNLNAVKEEYKKVSDEIMDLQLKLDKANQTVTFSVDI